ncbi:hypothetical protein [Bradyrhizobium sp. 139]|uniref:hypothetical protein n=1 Tax=Bradyrhizobium sp. 139 TaxID=2782616 RepID=UPI0031FEC473
MSVNAPFIALIGIGRQLALSGNSNAAPSFVPLSQGDNKCPVLNHGVVVGLTTRRNPVKNLTFSVDLAYTMLDQKYASGSIVTVPLQSAVAKPVLSKRRIRTANLVAARPAQW